MRTAEPSQYRPDIDGLRTVAVVPVVLFHAGIPFVTGGFVGVDVFFVISGFLITGIVAREMQEDRFSVLEFYRRRARRILPALTLVVLTTLMIGYLVLTPKEFVALGKSAATNAVFSSNFYFWKSVSYFDPGIQPLLHTWSLAVEEQYYLFFPLLLLTLNRRRDWLAPTLWVVFGLSLALSVAMVTMKPSAAFYLLPSRAWELMLGGLLALGRFGSATTQNQRRGASLLGLFLILVPMIAYTPSTPFPGLAALPPALGAALLIWGKGWGLTSRPIVAVGLVSYSLYLWHLPVIDFAKYLADAPLSLAGGLSAFAISLALAGLTYRFVESPFREGQDKQQLAIIASLGLPILAFASLSVVFFQGLPNRLTPLQARQLAAMNDEARHPSRCMTLDERWVDPAKPCKFGTQPNVLLWGDSHSMVTATSMLAAGVNFLFVADADCPIGKGLSVAPDHEVALVSQGHYRRCGEYNRLMLARALEPDVRTVVLSSRWTNWRIGEPANPSESEVDVRLVDASGTAASGPENRVKFERAFSKLVDELTSSGKEVVIVGPVPEPTFNVPHYLYVSGFGFAQMRSLTADYSDRHRAILSILSRYSRHKGVTLIWPAQALCKDVICPSAVHGKPLYFDHNHLTVEAARALAPLYGFLRG